MTRQEKLIVTSYNGVMMVDFDEFHEYITELLGRPIYSHELATDEIEAEIKEKVKPEFIKLCAEDTQK